MSWNACGGLRDSGGLIKGQRYTHERLCNTTGSLDQAWTGLHEREVSDSMSPSRGVWHGSYHRKAGAKEHPGEGKVAKGVTISKWRHSGPQWGFLSQRVPEATTAEVSKPQDSLTNDWQTWGESYRYVKHIRSKWPNNLLVWVILKLKRKFPGGTVIRTLLSPPNLGFNPGQATKIPWSHSMAKKVNKIPDCVNLGLALAGFWANGCQSIAKKINKLLHRRLIHITVVKKLFVELTLRIEREGNVLLIRSQYRRRSWKSWEAGLNLQRREKCEPGHWPYTNGNTAILLDAKVLQPKESAKWKETICGWQLLWWSSINHIPWTSILV